MAELFDQLEAVMAEVEAVTKRARAIQELRAREGRTIGKATRRALVGIQAGLKDLAALLDAPDSRPDPAIVREFERFQRLQEGRRDE